MQRTGEQTDSRSADSLDASPKLIPVDHDPFNDPIDFAELTEILGRPTFAAPVWADQLPPPPPVTTP
ncbi:MAG TPA: hypothetical protein VHK66_01300, partial [Microvirga sp.]|nr:hypothetical protein [Microvirga sp.]